jgi:hypothetical protein
VNAYPPPRPGPVNPPQKRPQWQVVLAILAVLLIGIPMAIGAVAFVFFGLVWLACSRH